LDGRCGQAAEKSNLDHAARLAGLDEQNAWSESALASVVETGQTQRIHLSNPIPVLIVYLTASTGPDQPVNFGRDVYDRDPRLLTVLDGSVTISPPG
jgi:murein L,D-transpeptidase YcbB/YkuD